MSQNLSFGRIFMGHHTTSSVQLTPPAALNQLASSLNRKPTELVCQRLRVGAATVLGDPAVPIASGVCPQGEWYFPG